MRRILSRILFTMFFGFTLTLIVCCVLLVVNNFSGNRSLFEAVSIDPKEEISTVYRKIDDSSMSENKQAKFICDFGYQSLADQGERQLYEKLGRNLYYITDKVEDSGCYKTERITIENAQVSELGIRRALGAFMSDNPQVFWINNIFGYAYDNDDTVIECYSVLSADKCKEYIDIMSSRIDELLEDVDKTADDFHRERQIHDLLLKQCVYADNITSINDGWEYFTAYGAIVEGSAGCEGYSKAVQLMLMKLGIPCYVIRGDADGVKHMWNLVKISGDWYHLDSTWDDGDTNINYEYFNLSTKLIEENHIISSLITGGEESEEDLSSPNFFIPDCNSMDMNFYTVDGYTINEFSNATDQQMVAYILKCVNNGECYVHLNVGSDLEYQDCIDILFNSPSHRLYHYIDLANGYLPSGRSLDNTGMMLLKHEDRRTLRIKLRFL